MYPNNSFFFHSLRVILTELNTFIDEKFEKDFIVTDLSPELVESNLVVLLVISNFQCCLEGNNDFFVFFSTLFDELLLDEHIVSDGKLWFMEKPLGGDSWHQC